MGKSLKRIIAEMPEEQQIALLDSLDLQTLQMMAREEWFFVQRPEQVPPPGDWTVHLYLAGRGCGKTRSGAEWLVQRCLDYPYDSSGFPTERLVVAYNLSDTRIVCIEGASGVLRVLQRLGFEEVKDYYKGDLEKKYHYTKSPKPHITLLETGTKIHFTGADPDAPRGFNLADVWCVAAGESVATARGMVPVEEVAAGDQVLTSKGLAVVSRAGLTRRDAEVVELVTDAGSVRLTAEHLVWADGGWVEAAQVSPGATMVTCLPQMTRHLHRCPPSTNGTANAGTATSATATTTAATDPYCTVASGSLPTAQSLTGSTSTTAIATDGTTFSATCGCFPTANTCVSPGTSEQTKTSIGHGVPPQQARGLLPCGNADHIYPSPAPNVDAPTTPLECEPSSAGSHAAMRLPSWQQETSVLRVAKAGRSDVYDLTVVGAAEFHAGSGLLKIHNCDEPVKWEDPMRVWREGIFPALRADLPGDKPRAFVTTTPKPIDLLQYWLEQTDGTVSMARGSTFDNADNLSDAFLDEARKMYEGTALGRQELYGEMLDAIEGMLFSWAAINGARVDIGPEHVSHRTVGVDPGLTGAEGGDEMGVVVACRDAKDHMYVLADETTRLAGRDAALHAWRVFEKYHCDTLVYESNLGKAWMHEVFVDAFKELQRSGVFPAEVMVPPLVPAFSTVGKKLRAEPVAMRYSQGRVHHIGRFELLEKQMLSWDPITSKVSPDRLDALVHAMRHLIDGERKVSRVLSPANFPIPSLDRRF